MNTKIIHSDIKVNPLGGLNFIVPFFRKHGLDKLIDEKLGSRSYQAKYSISDVILSHILSNFSGSTRLEHQLALKSQLDNIDGIELPSSDTTSRVFRSLATPNIVVEKIVEETIHSSHNINVAPKLNDLLIECALTLGLIHRRSQKNILDYDNSIIETKKFDATKTYKRTDSGNVKGYQPAFATINDIPVYVEGRSGHTNATTKIGDSFERVIDNLEKYDIHVSLFRSDAAGYSKKIIKICEEKNIDFIIRVPRTLSKRGLSRWRIKDDEWKIYVDGHGEIFDTASTWTYVKHNKKLESFVKHRLVIKKPHGSTDFTNQSFLLTNNNELSDAQVLNLYKERGRQEKKFAELKNDWNIKRPPFSLLEENTVFWIISLIGYQFFRYVVLKISKITKEIKPFNWLRILRSKILKTVVIIKPDKKLELVGCSPTLFMLFKKLIDDW